MSSALDLPLPYPVYIGADLLKTLSAEVKADKVALVSDSLVGSLHVGRVEGALEAAGKRVRRYLVPAGESSKRFEVLEGLLREMARDGLNRKSAVLALGGGVVGDLAGFAAAIFMRGIAFYNLPTSLLAMVDASVGGKTGINLPEGKNLVGAFWQPQAVLLDVDFLRTLPQRVFKQGAVELFKHGLLADESILESIYQPGFRPDGDPGFLTEVIGRSVAVKARIVARDEREAGERAHLNLGHSLAHALEAQSDHALSHGDAVGYGLVFAAKLAAERGMADETGKTLHFLRWLEPAPLGNATLDELRPYLARDKKGRRWVLLRRLGEPCLVDDITDRELEAAWRFLREATSGQTAPRDEPP
jgi:3-dehydroquinate synthase